MQRNFTDYVRDYTSLNFEDIQEKYRFKRLLELLSEMQTAHHSRNILEVGPGNNSVSKSFTDFDGYTILEPIEYFYSSLNGIDTKVQVRKETLEEYIESDTAIKFDLVILSSVVHELEDPVSTLIGLKDIIGLGSKVIVVVPNNLSLHRILGEREGHAKAGPTLTETERRMQQHTSFSVESLKGFAGTCGYLVTEVFTSFVKPLPHFKMHKLVNEEVISELDLDFLYSISKIMEPYGSEIFAVLEKSSD